MIIDDLKSGTENGRKRVSAKVTWEDCAREPQEIFIETDPEFAEGLSANPHAFLVVCTMVAMHHGEERIRLDAELCPELTDGLVTVMKRFAHWYNWYPADNPIVRIEAKKRYRKSLPPTSGRRGMFFSGGVDSLATLRNNRTNFPVGHPSSIDDGFLVYGLEVEDPRIFDYVMKTVPEIARDADLKLVPVYTNLRYLDDSWRFWEHQFMGALFSAVAHAFSRRINSVLIASHYDIPFVENPYGSHPMIDSYYGSSDLSIKHDRPLSRFEKTKMISDWECALKNLRVCNKTTLYESGQLNCSECEKCLRTMMALLACDVLDKSPAFKYDDVSPETIFDTVKMNRTVYSFYPDLIEPLRNAGRRDLATILQDKLDTYLNPSPVKKPLHRHVVDFVYKMDQDYLNSRIRRIKHSLQSRAAD